MSEHLVHTAIVDDCLVLIQRSTTLHPAFAAVVSEHAEVARLGGVTRYGDQYNPALLDQARIGYPWTDDTKAAPRLAFVLGWMSHRAADRNFKQVFRRLDANCANKPTDCSVYHDVEALKQVYASNSFPFDANLVDNKFHDTSLDHAIRSYVQRSLIALHTLTPDKADVGEWIDQLVHNRTRFTVDLTRYAAAYHNPDPDKVRRFLTEPNFYDAKDPILKMARAGVVAGPCDPLTACGPGQSLYATALTRAYGYIDAASRYFSRTIGEPELNELLDIGKPEVPLSAKVAVSAT